MVKEECPYLECDGELYVTDAVFFCISVLTGYKLVFSEKTDGHIFPYRLQLSGIGKSLKKPESEAETKKYFEAW